MSMIGELIGVSVDKLNRLLAEPEQVSEFIETEYANPENECYLGKSWHALHFLLTGSAWEGDPPESLAILGGTPIGDIDVRGYGPALYLTPEEVKAVAAALSAISTNELREVFILEDLHQAEIYSVGDNEEDEWEYVMDFYRDLVAFYKTAAEANQATVFWLH
jgi:hypothetical protein